jgi:hypothetical protein
MYKTEEPQWLENLRSHFQIISPWYVAAASELFRRLMFGRLLGLKSYGQDSCIGS